MDNNSNTGDPSSDDRITISTIAAAEDAENATNLLRAGRRRSWPTIDGPLGLNYDDSTAQARKFFKWGFLCLPLLWAVNCYYFWPVLRHPSSHPNNPQLRRYLVLSAIGFAVFTAVLSTWALTFSIGRERLFGHVWDDLVMYNVAEKYGLTGWM